MLVKHKFKMELDRRRLPATVDAVQGDKDSRAVEITLLCGNQPWEVPEGVSVMVRFRKPDGTGGIYDTLEDDSSAVTVAGNVITAILAKQVLTVPGTVRAQVELVKDDQEMATFTFVILVEPDLSIGAMDSEDYINLSGYVSKEVQRILDSKEIGSGLTVTFTGSASSGYVADKTFTEVSEALSAGTTVTGVLSSAALDIVLDNVIIENEQGYCSFNGQVRRYAGGEAIPIESITVILHADNTAELLWENIVTAETVGNYLPAKLPNPNALTINGQTYDGSEAVSVDTTPLVITVTGNETDGYTADKTSAEINAAYDASRLLVCTLDGVGQSIPLVRMHFGVGITRLYNFQSTLGTAYTRVLLNVAGPSIMVSVSTGDIGGMKTLTINGTTYDGTKAVTVDTSPLYIQVTQDESTGEWTADRSFGEAIVAFSAGRDVICGIDGMLAPLVAFDADGLVFAFTFTSDGYLFTNMVLLAPDGTVTVDQQMLETGEVVFTVQGNDTDGYTSDRSYEEVRAAHDVGRTVVCVLNTDDVNNFRTPLATVDDSSMTFMASPVSGQVALVQYTPDSIRAGAIIASVTISNQMWDMTAPIDFTDTINGMIDAKLAAITNAEEVAF